MADNFKNLKAGFTLIEILVVVTITAILATVGTVSYYGAIRRDQLDSYSKEIISALERARSKAINQEEGDYWGVRFEATTNSALSNFAIFKGATSGTTFIDVKKLSTNVNFTSPDPSGATPIVEIVFNKSTGTVKDGINHLIRLSNGSATKDIYINKNGLISLGLRLNSATGKTCNTLCTEMGGTCSGISSQGSSTLGTGYYISGSGCATMSGTCATAISSSGYTCLGIAGDFTYCNCGI